MIPERVQLQSTLFKERAQRAGIPVVRRAGEDGFYVTDATFKYLVSPHEPYDAPLLCTCSQRPYPHEVSLHRAVRFESHVLRWPWSLRFLPNGGEM